MANNKKTECVSLHDTNVKEKYALPTENMPLNRAPPIPGAGREMIGPKKMKDGCWMMSGLPVAMCGNSSVDN
jgi:hypothetical protein